MKTIGPFKLTCPECNRKVKHLVRHHIIDYYFVKYLVHICNFNPDEVKNLRRQLTIRLCIKCEIKKHEVNIYQEPIRIWRNRQNG